MNTEAIDTLGKKLGEAALTTLVRRCLEGRTATRAQHEAVCGAMRAKVSDTLDELLQDTKAAPRMAEVAFASAIMTRAQSTRNSAPEATARAGPQMSFPAGRNRALACTS